MLEFVGPELQRAAHERMTERYDDAVRSRQHLWVVMVGYFVSMPLEDGAVLDHENMATPPAVACYVCEQPYTRGDEHRRCPGEPRS